MVAARHTWEIDQEIVQLTCRKEQILLDLQDPISAGKWTALQQWLAAIQAHLATLQAIIDGWRNAPGLSVTQICWVGIWSGKLATLRLKNIREVFVVCHSLTAVLDFTGDLEKRF